MFGHSAPLEGCLSTAECRSVIRPADAVDAATMAHADEKDDRGDGVSSTASQARSYDDAIAALATTISGKKRADPGAMPWEAQFAQLDAYVARLGLRAGMDGLKVIHVAGTKGKGSTCAFVERVLREHGVRTGLFTSPHLLDVRERFRIDGEPVDEATFARHFWWMYDELEAKCGDLGIPAYFRFLTLLGLRIFSEEGAEACVLEVGLGGRLDATNVVRAPVVCGITSLGMDHVDILGDTIGKIATEKAGIMKPNVPAFTAPQPTEAMASLKRRAEEVAIPLNVSKSIDEYEDAENIEIGLAGPHQRINAGLAVTLCRNWANATGAPWAADAEAAFAKNILPPLFRVGLARTVWPGRSQVMSDPDYDNLTFYLDGAHTIESMRHSAEWFASTSRAAHEHNIMLFNCMDDRKAGDLLEPVAEVFAANPHCAIETAIFSPPDSSTAGLSPSASDKATAWQEKCARVWDDVASKHQGSLARRPQSAVFTNHDQKGLVIPSLTQALTLIRRRAVEVAPARVNVLVTGSLYLVGDCLRHLKRLV